MGRVSFLTIFQYIYTLVDTYSLNTIPQYTKTYCWLQRLKNYKNYSLTIKAVESEGESLSVPFPSVLIRTHVTKKTKMFDETVQAYLGKKKKQEGLNQLIKLLILYM